MTSETAKALVPLVPFDTVMKAIVESAKVSSVMRDLYTKQILAVPMSVQDYNPSRRDSN